MQREARTLSLTLYHHKYKGLQMNDARLSVGAIWKSNETICVVMKLQESTYQDLGIDHD